MAQGVSLVGEGGCTALESDPELLRMKAEMEATGHRVEFDRRLIQVTQLGRTFISACVVDRIEASPANPGLAPEPDTLTAVAGGGSPLAAWAGFDPGTPQNLVHQRAMVGIPLCPLVARWRTAMDSLHRSTVVCSA
jgi:hypothetical protein